MTREEAKEQFVKQVLGNRVGIYDTGWDTIDKIYDDFESRTCENCKYRLTNHAKDMFWCINEDGANKYRNMDIRVDLDFGCNKWESK